MDKEMMAALQADGDKLKAMTGRDHGPIFSSENPAKDWSEDANLENGSYYCKCCVCGCEFVGYKRRVACKECANHSHTKDHYGPHIPLRYGSAKSEVCACGAWRMVTHQDKPLPGWEWRKDSIVMAAKWDDDDEFF